jgi:hypothetical protein
MIDNASLRVLLQPELDKLSLTEQQEEQLTRELNVLACILIDAVQQQEGKPPVRKQRKW